MTDSIERESIFNLINEAVDSGAKKTEACSTLGIPMRTLQHWQNNTLGDKRPFTKNIPKNKLTQKERDEIISISCSEEYKDLSPNIIVPILAEKGRYIASESTIFRLYREEKMLAHRLESKPKTKHHKPDELIATGPDQVWSWDITYLSAEIKGQFYYLYMFEDIWSRAIRGWDIHEKQSEDYASILIDRICNEKNISTVNLHSDNGSPMKGATMLATLQRLGVIPSFSRPSVSNDNPYSESLFKTLKYSVGYPKSFNSIEEANEWVKNFVNWYNEIHRHSGIKFVTPMQRHSGEDKEILKRTKKTYEKAKKRNPERWSGKTRNWDYIEKVALNPDRIKESLLMAS